jgi:hypothetical protein
MRLRQRRFDGSRSVEAADSTEVRLMAPKDQEEREERHMLTCCIQYTLDPNVADAFEDYARTWPPIIERCGGHLVGYYLPKEGDNAFALALIDFPTLADYEQYRSRLSEDVDAQANVQRVRATKAILRESRSFLRRV